MQRGLQIATLACPTCGGRFRDIANIMTRDVIRRMLGHLGIQSAPPNLEPASLPDQPDGSPPSPAPVRSGFVHRRFNHLRFQPSTPVGPRSGPTSQKKGSVNFRAADGQRVRSDYALLHAGDSLQVTL